MKKFILTEEEKKQIRAIYEDRLLMESNSNNFILRRWATFKDAFDNNLKFSDVCNYKNDFDLYLGGLIWGITKALYQDPDFKIKNVEELDKFERVISKFILNNFIDEIKKHYEYESAQC